MGDESALMYTMNNLGLGCKNLGRHAEAVAFLERGLAIAERRGEPGPVAVMRSNLGEPLAALGRAEEARAVLALAVEGHARTGYVGGLTNARVQLADLHLACGDIDAASAEYEAALALIQQTGGRNHAARAHLGLYRVHKAAGRFEAALAAHEAYHAAERAQFNDESNRRLHALHVRHEVQRARRDAELHRLRAAEFAAQSRTDALTGLANRRHLDERLAHEVQHARALGQPLAVALADIDDFKRINDRLGHATGDEVLKALATVLRAQGRATDLVARYGGEEFCVVLPGTDIAGAAAACEALRAAVQAHDWPAVHPALRVTLSIGLAALGDTAPTAAALLREADRHLYDAKRLGKNRVRHG